VPGITKIMTLTNAQWERYARHVSLPEIGVEGQQKLLASRVLVVGAGGLGSPALLYLAAAGVGTIGIVDMDSVEASNLQRQVIHSTARTGRLKVESAHAALSDLNPDVSVIPLKTRITSQNALDILADFDLVVDGSDNFQTRYLTNDACVLTGKPNIFACVQGFQGQASVFWPSGPQAGPCYRCLFPEPPPPGTVPTCAENGVLGVLPGIMGLIQATEAIKIILGYGETLAGRLLMYDAESMGFRTIKVKRNSACPVCGESPTIRELIDYEIFCGAGAGELSADDKNRERSVMEQISVTDLKKRIDAGEDLVIIDVRNPDEHEKGAIPGARLMPLPELPRRVDELEDLKDKEVIIHCQKGGRSSRACGILTTRGFSHTVNVEGGYEAWSKLS
jgi:adenylyltransferase/sulfurtransferase